MAPEPTLTDRIVRLEVLQATDRERLDELRALVDRMDAKLDVLLARDAERHGGTSSITGALRTFIPAIWLALLAGMGALIDFYISHAWMRHQ
jgi:DNA helicase HerA-like ATPase